MKHLSFSSDLLRELVHKVGTVNGKDTGYVDMFLYGRRRKAIEDDANSHSYAMEHPCRSTPSKCRKDVKRGAKCLARAYSWGIENFGLESFDQDYIKSLAGHVDPILHKGFPAVYRRHEARIQGYAYSPESPEKLDREMGKFTREVKRLLGEGKICDVLSAAVYAHLHLVRVHPFEDTNGRTARTLQNVILNSARIPIPVIHSGEKRDYHAHIERAKWAWRERTSADNPQEALSEGEKDFNDFIGGKILVSLDTILKNSH